MAENLEIMMIKKLLCLVLLTLLCFGFNLPVLAEPNPLVINVSLGNEAGELKFIPNHFDFTVGQKYKLILKNPSPIKHYFTAKDFADVSWTQKVEAGQVEIKGAIHELELKPGAIAEWVFVPMKAGNYSLYCSVPGHREAGMVGEIVLKVS